MRILFFAHAGFLGASTRGGSIEPKAWLEVYGQTLKLHGHEVTRFEPATHKVRDFDLVHVFSSVNAETWSWLRDAGPAVVVTPSLALEPPEPRPRSRLRRVLRALAQRRWPPVDELAFARRVDHFLVPSGAWIPYLGAEWEIPGDLVTPLHEHPQKAAVIAERIYTAVRPL